jgi:Rieske Fe-S protein
VAGSAVVLQVSPGEFLALSAVCTHLGRIVTWQADEVISFVELLKGVEKETIC